MIEDERSLVHVVEQRRCFLVEEWQPVLQPRETTAFADRFVERIATCVGTELAQIVGAEPADRLLGQRHLARRVEREGARVTCRKLRHRIEGADRLDLVAEEVDA